jgi:prepilin-type N-terminal cleavage/methylation domain-containing protein/prepilin-type processing-associated H-X9-DG protein
MMRASRSAFTIVELLIVVSVIGVLVALLLPAVTAAREAARRRLCQSNLGQLSQAVQQYEISCGVYPAGTMERKGPILNWPAGYHHGWITRLLPHLEHKRTLDHVDFAVGVYDPRNAPVRRLTLEVLHCPSAVGARAARSDYAACHHDREAPIDDDNNGVFFLNSRVRHVEVTDGLSQTIFLGESAADEQNFGWMSGTRSTLRNTAWGPGAPAVMPPLFPLGAEGLPRLTARRRSELERGSAAAGGRGKVNPRLLFVGGFSGPHSGGASFAFGDGSIRFLSANIDASTYQRLGNRRDGRMLDDRSL